MLIQKQEALDTVVNCLIYIVSVSAEGSWWYSLSQTEEYLKYAKTLFDNFNYIVIYGNPVLDNTIESYDESELWKDVEESTDNTTVDEDSTF